MTFPRFLLLGALASLAVAPSAQIADNTGGPAPRTEAPQPEASVQTGPSLQ